MLQRELLRCGIHVEARNTKQGSDFFAAQSLSDNSNRPLRTPILVRAASRANFSVIRKHEKITNLVLAYVWHVRDGCSAKVYAMTYTEAITIASQMGWTKTASWKKFGWYTNNEPGKRLREALAPYESTPERWRILTRIK